MLTPASIIAMPADSRPAPAGRYVLEACTLGRICWASLDARRRRLVCRLEHGTPMTAGDLGAGTADAVVAACLPVCKRHLPPHIDRWGREAYRAEEAATCAWLANPTDQTEKAMLDCRASTEKARAAAWGWIAGRQDRVKASDRGHRTGLRAFAAMLAGANEKAAEG